MPVGPIHLDINQSPLDSQTGGFAIREGSTVFFVEAMMITSFLHKLRHINKCIHNPPHAP